MPPAALAAYRTSADAEAQAVLAAAGRRAKRKALAEVVRRFFLSSLGDDAAYKLACLALDRHDFVGASRLLDKIIETHPDPSMPQAELLARLAVAAAHVQDRETAEQARGSASGALGPRPPSEIVDLVVAEVDAATSPAKASLRGHERLAHGARQSEPHRPHDRPAGRSHQPHAVGIVGAGISARRRRRCPDMGWSQALPCKPSSASRRIASET